MKKILFLFLLFTPPTAFAQLNCTTPTSNGQTTPAPAVFSPPQTTLAPSDNVSLACSAFALATYGTFQADRHLCDSLVIPNDMDVSQGAVLQIRTGQRGGRFWNDNIVAGRKDIAGMNLPLTSAIGNTQATPNNISANVTINLALPAALLTQSVNTPDPNLGPVIDYIFQDDTEIQSANFQYCQLQPTVNLEFSDCCPRKQITIQGPWGPHTMPVYNKGELVIFKTDGTILEQGYHPILWELDQTGLNSWGYTRINQYGGWVCSTCQVPPGLIANNLLPANYNGGTQTFKSNTLYYFGLAIGSNWMSTGHYFYVGP
ncbi:hypothetical protein [Litorimonas sp. WD9-15]|uniref:hypothetical protein n=1 Tax=Litorimonas sp. WD9-15 TaxID=3418716 RepID=UPI003D025DAE